jgi:hypothetical protein
MVLVTSTSMVFAFYRSLGRTESGYDIAGSPSGISTYLRFNSTDVATFLSTDLANYMWSSEPQAPSASRETAIVYNVEDGSPYAYAFVIGGCSPAKPAYRNYIHNILVATRILRSEGSKADVFVFFQMSYDSPRDTLPEEDVRVLEAMNIKFRYIPKSKIENFFKTMLDKFRVLGLTEYRRVLFMDGDVMPTGNLDYLFELSDGPDAILKPNLVLTGSQEPANGGFFMLAPGEGELEEMNEIIHQREVKAQFLPHPYFDQVAGWGHEILPPDKWDRLYDSGTNWTFWAAFADQGLLYHWVKYAKKSVSIAYHDKIQNFGALPDGTIVLENTLDRPFANHSKPIKCLNRYKLCKMGAPRNDHVHFTGRSKPWFHGPPANVTVENRLDSDAHFWYYHLEQINDELDMGLNFTGWTTGRSRRPLLGMYPLYGAVLTSNTNLVGTKVEDGADIDNDAESMNTTRHNLTSGHLSASHQEHDHRSLPINATGTIPTVTATAFDHVTMVASVAGSGKATRAHTARSRHHHKHRRNAPAVLNTSSSEQEIA